jgi:hypothetical protein
MYFTLIFLCISVAYAISPPILLHECGTLNISFATYKLAQDISVQNSNFGYACFDITGPFVTLDGNGFKLSSPELLPGTGVHYTVEGVKIKNMHITNMRTGIRASGKFGEVYDNTITNGVNGIDVCATHTIVSGNIIGNFDANEESTAGIYVYFPALEPIDSSINITNNVISNIRGDSFVTGISVYYATSVHISYNQIFNLWGGILREEISVMHGNAHVSDNSFTEPSVESTLSTSELLLSILALAATFFISRSTYGRESDIKNVADKMKETELEEKEVDKKGRKFTEEERKEKEKEEVEMDGADEIRKSRLSFSLRSSPVGLG